MTNSELDTMMCNYFMAIATHFQWDMTFKSFFLECSKLLNMLEQTNHFANKTEKTEAARVLLREFCKAIKGNLNDEFIKQACNVLANDTEQMPDSTTFVIDEIYESGKGMLGNYSRYETHTNISQNKTTVNNTLSQSEHNVVSQPQAVTVESMICYACGEVIPAESKFCPYCSTSLWVQCPKCGKTYSSQYPACNQCGTNRKTYLERNTGKIEFMKKYGDRIDVNPDGSIKIPHHAFAHNNDISEIILPGLVKNIGIEAFAFSSLVSIIIPTGLEQIARRAFAYCSNLRSVVIPDTVIQIGSDCFRDCTSLQEINIPDSLINIAEDAFEGCDNLNENCRREIESRYKKRS